MMAKIRFGVSFFAFMFLGSCYSQTLVDTSGNYVWNFKPRFDHPTQRQSYLDHEKKADDRNGQSDAVKNLFLSNIDRFDKTYSSEMLAALLSSVLQSDVILLGRPSAFVFEIQYGNYQDGSFELQTVGVYTHCTIDISQRVIIPEFSLSFTY
jgi:hypothetical protein